MKYPVGTRVRVVDCYSGGNFQVGDIVRIDHIGFEDDLNCYGAVSPHDKQIWHLREDEVELVEENPPCYLPEKDNPYPFCVGRGIKACAHCTLWADYDPDEDESRVNRPLTRSQMNEMNGQPVWCKEMGLWAILYIEDGGDYAGVPFIAGVFGLERGVATQFDYNVQNRNLTLYKFKPEE